MPPLGTLELLLVVTLLALFAALIVGAFFLLRRTLRPSDQARRITELEREVADLRARQK